MVAVVAVVGFAALDTAWGVWGERGAGGGGGKEVDVDVADFLWWRVTLILMWGEGLLLYVGVVLLFWCVAVLPVVDLILLALANTLSKSESIFKNVAETDDGRGVWSLLSPIGVGVGVGVGVPLAVVPEESCRVQRYVCCCCTFQSFRECSSVARRVHSSLTAAVRSLMVEAKFWTSRSAFARAKLVVFICMICLSCVERYVSVV